MHTQPSLPLDGLTHEEQEAAAPLCPEVFALQRQAWEGPLHTHPHRLTLENHVIKLQKKKKSQVNLMFYVSDSGLSRIHRYPEVPAAHTATGWTHLV